MVQTYTGAMMAKIIQAFLLDMTEPYCFRFSYDLGKEKLAADRGRDTPPANTGQLIF